MNERISESSAFICYSHADEAWLRRIEVHLKPLQREYALDIWTDQKIEVGEKWKEIIIKKIEKSNILIILISSDFLASDFMTNVELPKILENAQANGARIFPICVGHSRFTKSSLSEFQAANDPNSPLDSLSKSEADKLLVEVAAKVQSHLDTRIESREGVSFDHEALEILSADSAYKLRDLDVIQEKAFYVNDLFRSNWPPILDHKIFRRCRIIGPAMIGPTGSTISGCIFKASPEELVTIVPEGFRAGVIGLLSSTLEDCVLEGIGLAGDENLRQQFLSGLSQDRF